MGGMVASGAALGLPGFWKAEQYLEDKEERAHVRGERKQAAADDKDYRTALSAKGLTPGAVKAKAGRNQAMTADLQSDRMVIQQHLPMWRIAQSNEEKASVLNGLFSNLSMGASEGNFVKVWDDRIFISNGEGEPLLIKAQEGKTLDDALENFFSDITNPKWRQELASEQEKRKHDFDKISKAGEVARANDDHATGNDIALANSKPFVLGAGQVAVDPKTGVELARGLPVATTQKQPAVVQEAQFIKGFLRNDPKFAGLSEEALDKAAYDIASSRSGLTRDEFVRQMTLKAMGSGLYDDNPKAAVEASEKLADLLYKTSQPASGSTDTPDWRSY